ncbi:LysR family transcriptional regulator [Niallia sp. Man26]|uniref:helix-turn-helix domain-containing protein n=1 Tax=Niallia sp. Man26 TaxID=2912824 RepID=UPI001EDA5429|nr:LysR family transcriptional regulator [Niallia sp. Man26]UPO86236.1 DNA-binding protein [Niallia sp. Man26]
MSKKPWRAEEIKLLQALVGQRSVTAIAKELGRTPGAVSNKLSRLGLGATRKQTGMLTARELADKLGVTTKTVVSWEAYGLKTVTRVTRYKKQFILIKMKNFWEWAEQNKSLIDFTKLSKKDFSTLPEWVSGNIKAARTSVRYRHWTTSELKKLHVLIEKGLTYKQISKLLNRSESSVEKRYSRLIKGIRKSG